MLHTLKPEAFVAPEMLHTMWGCCNCSNSFIFGNGIILLAHFKSKETGETGVGLMCFCSTECGLSFEHHSFMARA